MYALVIAVKILGRVRMAVAHVLYPGKEIRVYHLKIEDGEDMLATNSDGHEAHGFSKRLWRATAWHVCRRVALLC